MKNIITNNSGESEDCSTKGGESTGKDHENMRYPASIPKDWFWPYERCFIIGSQNTKIYVIPWFTGSDSLIQGEVFCVPSGCLVKSGWKGIKITLQKPTADHWSVQFSQIILTRQHRLPPMCWTLALNYIAQQSIRFS